MWGKKRDGLHLSGKGAAFFAEGLSGAVASGLGRMIFTSWAGGFVKEGSKSTSGCKGIQGNTSKAEIKCVCLNARSIINNKNELDIMVDEIKPHIVGSVLPRPFLQGATPCLF